MALASWAWMPSSLLLLPLQERRRQLAADVGVQCCGSARTAPPREGSRRGDAARRVVEAESLPQDRSHTAMIVDAGGDGELA